MVYVLDAFQANGVYFVFARGSSLAGEEEGDGGSASEEEGDGGSAVEEEGDGGSAGEGGSVNCTM